MCAGSWARRCVSRFFFSDLSLVADVTSFLARARARPRRASPPVSDLQHVPLAPPPDDLVPGNLPEVPLRGIDSASLSELLVWRAELDAATLECSDAAAAQSNANARASMALKRRRTARDRCLVLLAKVRSSSGSPSPSVGSTSPGPVGKGKARRASSLHAEDEAAESADDVFEGLSVDSGDSGELGAEAMDLR